MIVQDEGALFADIAMQRDVDLLKTGSEPLLRFYHWARPSITVGILNEEGLIDEKLAKSLGIDVARRPTGGATLIHGHDLAFSLFIPNANFLKETSYLKVNEALIQAAAQAYSLKGFSLAQDGLRASRGGFCMADCSLYDPLLNGKKVGGAAQRRTRRGFLHQGSLFLQEPKWALFARLFDAQTLEKMQSSTTFLGVKEVEEFKEIFAQSVEESLQSSFQVEGC